MHTSFPLRAARALPLVLAPALLQLQAAGQTAQPQTASPVVQFQTPGYPTYGVYATGQSDRFDSTINPAFGVVIDAQASWFDSDADGDGLDLSLRTLELTGQGYLDPTAWAYFVGAVEDEALNIEEAAINYIGLEGNSTFKAGRFFVDFGKQMQIHPHDLRTVDRPLVLREYLGEELGGDGLQWDHWIPVGPGAVRWSVGVFGSLLSDHEHGEEEEEGGAEQFAPDLKDVDELHATARLTGFFDVGDNGMIQVGGSVRSIPEFGFELEDSGDALTGLSNQVYGLDLTYGWTGDEGNRTVTFGGEYLINSGDNGAGVDDQGTPLDPSDDTLILFDDAVSGYYAFLDYGWNRAHSVGVQFSSAELADGAESRVDEVQVYLTKLFSEFHRLRFSVGTIDSEVDGDSLQVALQYTGFLGAHAHGVNW